MDIQVTFYQGEKPIRLVPHDVEIKEAQETIAAAIQNGRVFIPNDYDAIINPAASVHIEFGYYLPEDGVTTYDIDRDSFLGIAPLVTPYS